MGRGDGAQLSLFDVGIEPPASHPKHYYVHVGDACPDNGEHLCCIDCRRMGMAVKGCDPCQNVEPGECENARKVGINCEKS